VNARVAHVATVDLTHRFLLFGQLLRLRDEGYEVFAISAPGPWTADLEAEGIHHIPWHHATRSWDPAEDARAFAELVGILKRGRFDLVHTHNPKPGVMGRMAARLAGVPGVINTVHGLYATPDDRLRKRVPVLGLEGIAARCSDLELYQSEEDLRWARRIGLVPRGRSLLLGNGTDLEKFAPTAVGSRRLAQLRRELGISPGAPVVGTVGRLVREKGYREYFAAAREVRRRMPEVRFLAVGGPDPEKADSIDPAEAGDDVIVTGWRDDVRDLMGLMDVFVLASWREGVPRSAIEAAAMGRAMVLTDVRGCREVVRDGIEGVLVPPRRPDRLASAITGLLRDDEERGRMGKAARARAEERFDERRVLDTVARVTAELLRRKGIGAAGGDGSAQVRVARPADAVAIARLHRQAMPTAFLPRLGDGFLRQLYLGLGSDPAAISLVAENASGVVGFAAGVRSVPAFYRRFALRRGIAAAVAAAPALAMPGALRRARESAAYPSGSASLPEAELLAIGVVPGWRSKGLGERLADGVLRGLAERGAPEAKVVVGAGNEGANRFYERIGFRKAGQIDVHAGEPSNVWVITLGDHAGGVRVVPS